MTPQRLLFEINEKVLKVTHVRSMSVHLCIWAIIPSLFDLIIFNFKCSLFRDSLVSELHVLLNLKTEYVNGHSTFVPFAKILVRYLKR